MGGVRGVLGGLVLDRLLATAPSLASRNKSQTFLMGFAAIATIAAFIFLLIAMDKMMTREYSADIAALITGLSALLIALVAAGSAYAMRHFRRSKFERKAHEFKHHMETTLKNLEGDWDSPIRENPKTAMALAGLVGYLLGDHIL